MRRNWLAAGLGGVILAGSGAAWTVGVATAAEGKQKPAAVGVGLSASAEVEGALAKIFVTGAGWEPVAQGLGFADAPACDADENFYFADMKSTPPAIWRVSADGVKTKLAEGSRSGMDLGPDGRLYACGDGKAFVYTLPAHGAKDAQAKEELLASDLATNDVAVAGPGQLFITETKKSQVTFVDAKTKQVRPAAEGLAKPNGIAVSTDRKRLLVSEAGGDKVWSFAIQPDGTLTDKKAFATLKALPNKGGAAGGDGMCVDTDGRVYVTSPAGLQVFDADGSALGILPKPNDKPLTSCGFGGKGLGYLYITCGDQVLRRKTQVTGAVATKK